MLYFAHLDVLPLSHSTPVPFSTPSDYEPRNSSAHPPKLQALSSPVEPCSQASPQHATGHCHQPCAAKDMLLALLCRWLIADSALVVKPASSSTEASAGPVRPVTDEQPDHKAGCGQSCLKVNRPLQPYLYVPIFALVAPRFSRGRGRQLAVAGPFFWPVVRL